MQIIFELDDEAVLDVSKTVNVSFLLDKAYKLVKPEMLAKITHTRQTLSSFQVWFSKLTPIEKEHVTHSINSTIKVEEIVPENVKNRDLIIEAIKTYRKHQEEHDRVQDAEVVSVKPDDSSL
jgi:hypothetical protein